MKRLISRIFRRTTELDRTWAASALSQLVFDAEPGADLLPGIEARIDEEEPHGSAYSALWHRGLRIAGTLFSVAAIFAGLSYLAGPERHHIVTRQESSADWIAVGAISLHGCSLRDFVASKCKGNTHFSVSLRAVRYSAGAPDTLPDPVSPTSEEKILMACNF